MTHSTSTSSTLRFICAAALLLTALAVRNSSAADYYVSPGSSITNAMAAANPGDTVHVNAGTYNENVQINKSGTSGAYITLVANGAVVINAGGAGKALRIAANYIIVNGFECTNYLEGLNMRTAHIKVYNCNFHSGTSGTSLVSGSNGLTVNFDSAIDDIDIENSNFYYNDAGGADFGCNSTTDVLTNITLVNDKFYANNCLGGTDGIGIGHQGTKANITLLHCQAYDNLSDGFDLDAPVYMDGCIAHDNDRNGGPNWGVGLKAWGHTGNPPVYGQVRLYNCLSYNNTEEAAGGGGINVGGANSIVSNCLVSGNNSYAGIILCAGSSVTIKNTIFYKEHYSISADSDVSGLTFDASNIIFNCQSNGALSSAAAAQAKSFDPLFVGTTDFHLQSSSPAIDAGVTVSGVTQDADGNPRPSGNGFDIGPYEYQSAVVPAPVINSSTSASGTTGSAFSYTITASNSPTSFNATGLPAGLSVNTSTGVISGTPTAAGSSSVSISAKNSGGTGTATLTITISATVIAPVITSSTSASGTTGSAFSYTITASNSPTSFNATGLPAGLSVNTSTGVISGTPTAAGSSNVSISAKNSGGTGTATLTITINAAVIAPVITSSTSASGTTGSAFSYTITASNSPTSFNATSLPAGLSVNTSTGVISGTPTAAGSSSVSISAKNSGGTGTATLTITISAANVAPVITSAPFASPNPATTGQAVSFTMAASDANGDSLTYTWNFGDSTNGSGASVSHTYSSAGTFTASVTVTDGKGGSVSGSVNVTVSPAAIGPNLGFEAPFVGAAGQYGSFQYNPTGAAWTFSGQSGISANGSGFTSGNPGAPEGNQVAIVQSAGSFSQALSGFQAATSYTFVFSAAMRGNNGGVEDFQVFLDSTSLGVFAPNSSTYQDFTTSSIVPGAGNHTLSFVGINSRGGDNTSFIDNIRISAKAVVSPPAITSANSASGMTGASFSYTITASNSPTSFNATGLPSGLAVNTSNGVISGTPSAAGSFNVVISASNSGGTGSANLALTITATPPPAPVITSATSATGTAGSAFSYTITASNTPSSFDATGLPAGLSVDPQTGIISGTPTTTGNSSVTLSATNTGGTGSATLNIAIAPAGNTLHISAIGMKLSGTTRSKSAVATISVVNGSGAVVSKAKVSGSWSGLTTATVSGTTTTAGTVKFTSVKSTATGAFTFTVTNIVLTGSTYVPSQNVATSASITTGGVVTLASTDAPALAPTGADAAVPAPSIGTATVAAVGAIDLGTVKIKQAFKVKLTLPAGFPSTGVKSKATTLPKGLRVSGIYVGGKPTTAGVFSFSVTSQAKSTSVGADGKRVATPVQITQLYSITVVQ